LETSVAFYIKKSSVFKTYLVATLSMAYTPSEGAS